MKKPLQHCKTFYFASQEDWDYASPLRAMAQWVKRHPDVVVVSVNVHSSDDGLIYVSLTIEEAMEMSLT